MNMPIVMNMPKLGVNMTDATIVEWVVKPGAHIKEGDHILDAETDKAIQEIYATVSGVLTKILAPEGEEVLCQQPIAEFMEPGEQIEEAAAAPATPKAEEKELPEAPKPEPSAAKPPKSQPVPPRSTPVAASDRIRISPLARKMARGHGH